MAAFFSFALGVGRKEEKQKREICNSHKTSVPLWRILKIDKSLSYMKLSVELQNKLSQCDKCQQQLWAYRPLSDDTLKSLREYYRVGLTYTSNALEGNSLTERLGRSLRTTQRYLKILTEKQQIVFQGVAKKGGYVAV